MIHIRHTIMQIFITDLTSMDWLVAENVKDPVHFSTNKIMPRFLPISAFPTPHLVLPYTPAHHSLTMQPQPTPPHPNPVLFHPAPPYNHHPLTHHSQRHPTHPLAAHPTPPLRSPPGRAARYLARNVNHVPAAKRMAVDNTTAPSSCRAKS